MADEVVESTESTSTETQADAIVGAEGGEITSTGTAQDNGEAAAAQAAANQYTPNYKFRAGDKDYEIPEEFRGVIKNADLEKKAREIFEKAYGLDVVKPKLQEVRGERDSFKTQVTNLQSGIQDLRDTYQRGDLDSFFQKLNIPEQKVLQWVMDKINYNNLPPEQKAMVDSQKTAQQRTFELERQNQTYQEQVVTAQRQAKSTAMEYSLARPDIQTVVEAFDSRVGRAGAFREAVRAHGEATWLRTNGQVDLTPEQAVKQVMDLYGITAANAAPGKQPGVVTAGAAPGGTKPKVIPNISGRSAASPVSSKPRSIEDLKKLSAALNEG